MTTTELPDPDLIGPEVTTRQLLDRAGELARDLDQLENAAKDVRAERLRVWKSLLARGVKAAEVEAADGHVTRMAVRDAIRQDKARRQRAAAAAAPRARRPRPS